MTQVFVLCTGRCGSTTFARAAEHITNYTVKHESRTHLLGPARLAYPTRHIEVDNRLAWWLGNLDQTFGDTPYFVHLTRDPTEVAASYANRKHYGLLKGYHKSLLCHRMRPNTETDMTKIAADMVATITANITHFLRDKTKVMQMPLETIEKDFPTFWHWIGAKGDLPAALAEWTVLHNASQ